MLAVERQAQILELVERNGVVRVSDLAAQFGVSDMTIRRDLDTLVARGSLDKVHGGATTRRPASTEEPGFDTKSAQQQEEKEAIARQAVQLVRPGSAIGLSAGTTTWTLARYLREVPQLTVVTNSMRVAEVLQADRDMESNVVLTGGVRTPSDALVGPLAVSALTQLHLDIVFLGVHGVETKAGFTTPNLLEAETNRALVAAGRRLVVLADHSKWATVGISTIAALEQADVLITDDGMPQDARETLAEYIDEVIVAPVGPER